LEGNGRDLIEVLTCQLRGVRDTHSEYVILIAFPLQQWLNERASL